MSNGKSHILYYMNREFGSFYIVDFAFTPYRKGASFFVSRLKDCVSILKVNAFISCALGNVLKSGCTSQTIEMKNTPIPVRAKIVELLTVVAKYPPYKEPIGIATTLMLYMTVLTLPKIWFGMTA
ncbi:hypothetical protein [Guptibacillus spartinae]|uniref:hypothetical protein n=1 Tax=Guptibacillus spartinae TaxID=3025679 RepID=UPI002360D58D|nr:hypothetical protein [Pseudalkalibacillus spartinae]